MDMDSSPQTRRWNRGGFPTWAKMLVAVAVVLLFSLVFFRVRTFEVSGNVRYTAEEVAEASGEQNPNRQPAAGEAPLCGGGSGL